MGAKDKNGSSAKQPTQAEKDLAGAGQNVWYNNNVNVAGMPKADSAGSQAHWDFSGGGGAAKEGSGASNVLFPNDRVVGNEPEVFELFIDEITGAETHTHHANGSEVDADELTKNIQLAFETMHKRVGEVKGGERPAKAANNKMSSGSAYYQWYSNTNNDNPVQAPEHAYSEVTATYNEKGYIPQSSKTRMREFIISHPFIAMSIGKPEDESVNISNSVVRFVEIKQNENSKETILKESKYKEVPEGAENRGSEVNAFRHVLWQSVITNKFGENIAKEVGDAHEDNPWVDLSKRIFSGENKYKDADQVVDLLNNKIAREELTINNLNDNTKQLADKVLDYFYLQGLWTFKTDAKGNVVVTRTKITKDQYGLMKTAIGNRNEYGYTQKKWDEKMKEAEKEAEKERRKMLREPKF